jgi:hypothetical protein
MRAKREIVTGQFVHIRNPWTRSAKFRQKAGKSISESRMNDCSVARADARVKQPQSRPSLTSCDTDSCYPHLECRDSLDSNDIV